MNTKSVKFCDIELKDLDHSSGKVAFYFSPFNTPDADMDEAEEKAFDKTFSENKARVKHLRNHITAEAPGKIIELSKDSKGAFAVSQLALKTSVGADTFEQYKAGIITEHSYGFDVIRAEKKSTGGRIFKEVRLWEVSSLTHWGCSQHTPTMYVKSIDEIESYIKKLNKLLTSSTISDEKAATILEQYKELNETMISLKEQIAPPASTQPVIEPSKFDLKYIADKLNLKN